MVQYSNDTRQNEYEYLLLLRRSKVISAVEYRTEKAKIDRREAKAQETARRREEKKEQERQRREAEREREKAEAKAKAKAKKVQEKNRRREAMLIARRSINTSYDATDVLLINEVYPPEEAENKEEYLYEWLKARIGRGDFTIVGRVLDGNEWDTVFMINHLATDEESFASWFASNKFSLINENSSFHTRFARFNSNLGTYDAYDEARVYILPVAQVEAVQIVDQFFAEGDQHCVFSPASAFWRKHADTMETAKRRKMCLTYADRCDALAIKYPKGVSASQLEMELPKIGLTMTICDFLMTKSHHLAKVTHDEGNRVALQYVNTISNHLELMESNKPKVVSADEMGVLFKEAIKGACSYRTSNRVSVPTYLNTGKDEYKLSNDADEILNRFGKEVGLVHFKFDAVENKPLWNFLHDAISCGSLSIPATVEGEFDEIDKVSAYANFHTNPYYKMFGLPASIHHFRDLPFVEDVNKWIIENPGIYRGCVWGIPAVAEKFGMSNYGNYTFHSCIWKWLIDRGASIRLMTGAYGSTCDWKFNTEMASGRMPTYKGRKGARLYAVYVGRLMMKCDEIKTILKTDLKMLQHLRSAGYNIRRFDKDDNGMIYAEVVQRKSDSYTAIHQGIAIHNYTILHTLMEAEKYDIDDVVGIHLDALFVPKGKGIETDDFKIKKTYSGKLSKVMEMFGETRDRFSDVAEEGFTAPTLLLGAGGTGKTECIMKSNSGYVSPCYTAKAWRQCVSKKLHYKKKAFCINNLLGIDALGKATVSFIDRFLFVPPVIFADEITQYPMSYLEELRKKFPYSLIIGAGDYDDRGRPFQTSENGIVKLPNWKKVTFTKDYRAINSPKLVDMKLRIREFMSANYGKTSALINWVLKEFSDRVITKDEVISTIGTNDWLLTTTRTAEDSQTKTWTAEITGKRPDLPVKHLVVKHSIADVLKRSAGEEAYLKGDIVSSEIEGRTEARHAFTIHAVQGETITNKVFVDVYGMFDFSALYTAVSRATIYENVFLVINRG
jgi:hypothetical protein